VAICAAKPQFVCGYTDGGDDNNDIVPGYFSVCLYNTEKDEYKSKCLDAATLGQLGEEDMLSSKEMIMNCGCCPDNENDAPDFCDYKAIDCPIQEYECGQKSRKGFDTPVYQVEYCYSDSGGRKTKGAGRRTKRSGSGSGKKTKQKTKCSDPFKNIDEEVIGCGATCEPLLPSDLFENVGDVII
jgi:hypothetical protein